MSGMPFQITSGPRLAESGATATNDNGGGLTVIRSNPVMNIVAVVAIVVAFILLIKMLKKKKR